MPALMGARPGEGLIGGSGEVPLPLSFPVGPRSLLCLGPDTAAQAGVKCPIPKATASKSQEKVLHPQILTPTSPTAPWPSVPVSRPTGQDREESGPYILSQVGTQRHKEGKRQTHKWMPVGPTGWMPVSGRAKTSLRAKDPVPRERDPV